MAVGSTGGARTGVGGTGVAVGEAVTAGGRIGVGGTTVGGTGVTEGATTNVGRTTVGGITVGTAEAGGVAVGNTGKVVGNTGGGIMGEELGNDESVGASTEADVDVGRISVALGKVSVGEDAGYGCGGGGRIGVAVSPEGVFRPGVLSTGKLGVCPAPGFRTPVPLAVAEAVTTKLGVEVDFNGPLGVGTGFCASGLGVGSSLTKISQSNCSVLSRRWRPLGPATHV